MPIRGSRLNPKTVPEGQGELFAAHRHHAFLTDSPLIITQAEPNHRRHAVIEQVFSDLEDGPLGHLPSGTFQANAAWLVLAALSCNLTRAIGTLAGRFPAKATGATIRRNLINIPARIATSARRIRLYLPENRPWPPGFLTLWTRTGHRPIQTRPTATPRPPPQKEPRRPRPDGHPAITPAHVARQNRSQPKNQTSKTGSVDRGSGLCG